MWQVDWQSSKDSWTGRAETVTEPTPVGAATCGIIAQPSSLPGADLVNHVGLHGGAAPIACRDLTDDRRSDLQAFPGAALYAACLCTRDQRP
jgi:hypothetical protein